MTQCPTSTATRQTKLKGRRRKSCRWPRWLRREKGPVRIQKCGMPSQFSATKCSLCEQCSDCSFIIHRHVQVSRRDAHVGVASGVANLGKRAAAGHSVADERVAAVVDTCHDVRQNHARIELVTPIRNSDRCVHSRLILVGLSLQLGTTRKTNRSHASRYHHPKQRPFGGATGWPRH
jgi:hypothetical protein